MTREETQKVLMAIATSYPAYKIPNERKTATVDLWHEMLEDLTYEEVSKALKVFISTDTKGFAPSIGQIRAAVRSYDQEDMTDSEAWSLVYNALCNSNYNAAEEYNKLPPDVRRSVGGVSALQAWAMMDEDAITVAESNFKRTYRAIMENRKRDAMLPQNMRPRIGTAAYAQIPDKTEIRPQGNTADPDKVHDMLENLYRKWSEE